MATYQTNFTAGSFPSVLEDNLDAVEAAAVEADVEPEPVDEPGNGDVPAGSVEDVLTWVGDDKVRAQQALDAESARKPTRKTAVSALTEILEG